jgi:NAD(P)-dependent dehydrogenase (short-subunit alcohol dehydrogenase family)
MRPGQNEPMDGSLVVTGASGGLGGAVASRLVADGWHVVAPTIDPAHRHPDGVVVVEADLTDEEQVAKVVEVAVAEAPLRAVVNLVGGYAGGTNVHELALDDFERQFTQNLRPTFLVTRAALPHLVAAGGGSIVCVGSRAAVQPFPGASGYIASKAAVIAFAKAVAVEYRDAGVRCNVVLPSIIDTPGNRASQPGADASRWVAPAQIAATILFLASDESAATSGTTVPVYGRA